MDIVQSISRISCEAVHICRKIWIMDLLIQYCRMVFCVNNWWARARAAAKKLDEKGVGFVIRFLANIEKKIKSFSFDYSKSGELVIGTVCSSYTEDRVTCLLSVDFRLARELETVRARRLFIAVRIPIQVRWRLILSVRIGPFKVVNYRGKRKRKSYIRCKSLRLICGRWHFRSTYNVERTLRYSWFSGPVGGLAQTFQ